MTRSLTNSSSTTALCRVNIPNGRNSGAAMVDEQRLLARLPLTRAYGWSPEAD